MDKLEVARVLEEMADLLELRGANPFQVLAHRNGAQNLLDWQGDLAAAVHERTLTEIPGIGKGLAAVIAGLVSDGRAAAHEELRASVPVTMLDLLRVPRLGPKRVRLLHEVLGIDSLDSLEVAVREQRVRTVRGFGAKTEEALLRGIERARRRKREA